MSNTFGALPPPADEISMSEGDDAANSSSGDEDVKDPGEGYQSGGGAGGGGSAGDCS